VNYFKYEFPEKVQNVFIFVSYNFIYLYSKLQIILHKNGRLLHSNLSKYERYNITMNKLTRIYDIIYEERSDETSDEYANETINETIDELANSEIVNSEVSNEDIKKNI
jgi:hypothetical protein